MGLVFWMCSLLALPVLESAKILTVCLIGEWGSSDTDAPFIYSYYLKKKKDTAHIYHVCARWSSF